MHSEPNGRLAYRRPRYAMGAMSGNQDIVTRTKLAFAFSLDPETSSAEDKQYPLVPSLVVRSVRWRGLAGRDDPLDPDALPREQLRKEFLACLQGNVVEEIH